MASVSFHIANLLEKVSVDISEESACTCGWCDWLVVKLQC